MGLWEGEGILQSETLFDVRVVWFLHENKWRIVIKWDLVNNPEQKKWGGHLIAYDMFCLFHRRFVHRVGANHMAETFEMMGLLCFRIHATVLARCWCWILVSF